jgi:hypothetical protein
MDDAMNQEDPAQQEGDDVTRLSIVVRPLVPDDPTPRVWLIYEREGSRLALATSGDDPYELIRETELPALAETDAWRVRELSAEERARFEEALNRISEVSDAGLPVWTPLRTSEAFAAGIWEAAVGEKLQHSVFGRSAPKTLAHSIRAANARELGLSQDDQEPIELHLSPRKRAWGQDLDDGGQAHRQGQSL